MSARHVYVSPAGHDAGTGSRQQPFATLTRALAAVRERPAAARQIRLLAGRWLDARVELTGADSGVTIAAAPGATPVLCGGRLVTGWQREGDWVWAPLPGVREGTWDFRALIVNGAFRPRARLPQTGFFHHENVFNVRWMSSTYGGWERKPTETELTTLRYRAGDLGDWLVPANAEVQVMHMWDESLVGVATHDAATRTLTFSSPSGHPPGAFNWSGANTKANSYAVWNVREGMLAPGQWYLDRAAGRVVYWPLPGEDVARREVIAPTTPSILRLTGTAAAPLRDITLRGLTLMATSTPLKAAGFGACSLDGAVHVVGAVEDLRCERLTITHTSGLGLKVVGAGKDEPCARTIIANCTTRQTGAGAFFVRGSDNQVVRNTVRDTGVIYPSALGLSVVGPDALISHNDIDGTSYSACQGGGARQRYEHNVFRNFMRDLDDGAAIYVFGGDGTVYRHNIAFGAAGRWASAYYLDEQCQNCTVEENIAINTRWPSHNHMARHNTIRRNLFVDHGDALITLMRCEDFLFEENVVVAGGGILVRGVNVFRAMPRNLFWSGAGRLEGEALQEYAGQGKGPLALRDGSIAADPQFVNAAAGDFRFRPNSPARALGLPELMLPEKLRPLARSAAQG